MIVDFSEVLTVLGISASTPEASLATLLHRRVERLVKGYVGYNVEQADHVEYLPSGPGYAPTASLLACEPWGIGGGYASGWCLYLSNLPVRSVTSVFVNQAAWLATSGAAEGDWPESSLWPASAYRVDWQSPGVCNSGFLITERGWPLAPRSVRVTYNAGWSPEELDDEASDFKLGVLQGVQKVFNEVRAHAAAVGTAGTGAIASEALDGQSFAYAGALQNAGLQVGLPPVVLKLLEPRVRLSR